MDQLRDYTVLDFFEESHTLKVEFGIGNVLNIIVPIDPLTNMYLVGEDLHKYIMSFKPISPKIPYKTPSIVLNKDEIYKLVDKKTKQKIDIFSLATMAKQHRFMCLNETDWTQLPDANKNLTDEDKISWKNYRQKLRDITSQPGWPADIDWPKRPHFLGVTIYD
jgi:hypothetical protein